MKTQSVLKHVDEWSSRKPVLWQNLKSHSVDGRRHIWGGVEVHVCVSIALRRFFFLLFGFRRHFSACACAEYKVLEKLNNRDQAHSNPQSDLSTCNPLAFYNVRWLNETNALINSTENGCTQFRSITITCMPNSLIFFRMSKSTFFRQILFLIDGNLFSHLCRSAKMIRRFAWTEFLSWNRCFQMKCPTKDSFLSCTWPIDLKVAETQIAKRTSILRRKHVLFTATKKWNYLSSLYSE